MCTMTLNSQFNGIELTFAGKPAEEIREAMKAAGFRWHRQKKLWYAKNTVDRMALAEKLSGQQAAPETAPAPAAAGSEPVSKFGIKIGDIVEGSFGYNMTIAEIYKVTKILSPQYVEIVEIGRTLVDAERGGSEYFMPDPEKIIGEPIRKKVSPCRHSNDGSWYIKLNESCNLYKWNGSRIYQNTWD